MLNRAEIKQKLEMEQVHGRLCNWGRWLRHDVRGVRGYPTRAPFVFSPRAGGMIADLDAEEIEFVVSSFWMLRELQPYGELYAFVLRIYYAQRSTDHTPPQEVLAKDVSKRFKRPCSNRSFRRHLLNARKAVMAWSGDIK